MNFSNIMTSRKAGLITLVAVLGLAACAPMDPETGTFVDTATPETSSMKKQINVQKLRPVFVARFEADSDQFTDMEKGRLLGFIEYQNAQFGDVLQLELPPLGGSNSVDEVRYGAIGSFLMDEGFKVKPIVQKEGLQNSLRIYFTKYVATVDPECAKGWRKPVGNDYENLPLPHMGCSTASSLAQMVANPKDLVEPASMGGHDGERAALSIRKYRIGGTSADSSEGESASKGSSENSSK